MQISFRTLLLLLTVISIYACEPENLPTEPKGTAHFEEIKQSADTGNEHNPIDDEKDD